MSETTKYLLRPRGLSNRMFMAIAMPLSVIGALILLFVVVVL